MISETIISRVADEFLASKSIPYGIVSMDILIRPKDKRIVWNENGKCSS